MPEFAFTIIGTEGSIRVDDNMLEIHPKNSAIKKLYRQDLNDHVPFYIGDSEYYREDEHFISCVLSGQTPESNFENGRQVDHLIEQVRAKSHE